jgi:hypothetical protein
VRAHRAKPGIAWRALAIALALTGAAAAEVPEWVPDRPNATVAPTVVPLGFIGMDLGASYEGWRPGNDDLLTFPIKLRLPVAETLEVQLGWATWGWSDTRDSGAHTGSGDVFYAARWVATQGEGFVPPLAVEVGGTIPAATRRPDFGPGTPSFYALLATEISPYEAVWLDLNFGVELTGRRGRHQDFLGNEFASAALGLDVAGLLFPYVEVEWAATRGGNDSDFVSGDVGLAWFITERLAIDAAVFWGMSDTAPDLGATLGVSFLLGPLE